MQTQILKSSKAFLHTLFNVIFQSKPKTKLLKQSSTNCENDYLNCITLTGESSAAYRQNHTIWTIIISKLNIQDEIIINFPFFFKFTFNNFGMQQVNKVKYLLIERSIFLNFSFKLHFQPKSCQVVTLLLVTSLINFKENLGFCQNQ